MTSVVSISKGQPCPTSSCIVDTHAPAIYPGCRCKHNFYKLSFVQYVRTLRLQFLAAFHKCHLSKSPWSSGASWLPSCTKILLKVRTRPAAIALNYSVKNIRNDVRQIIIIIIIIIIIFDEKSRFNSLVWGSLTLAQLFNSLLTTYTQSHSKVVTCM